MRNNNQPAIEQGIPLSDLTIDELQREIKHWGKTTDDYDDRTNLMFLQLCQNELQAKRTERHWAILNKATWALFAVTLLYAMAFVYDVLFSQICS
jgi:hypothetical protein